MIRTTCFLALATAWCADAVLMYALAEARWGSVLNRLFANMLLACAVAALVIAIGPQLCRACDRLSARARVYFGLGWRGSLRIQSARASHRHTVA